MYNFGVLPSLKNTLFKKSINGIYDSNLECGIFGPSMVKNSIRTTGVKLASPYLMFATPAFGSGGNLDALWDILYTFIGTRYYGLSKFFPL